MYQSFTDATCEKKTRQVGPVGTSVINYIAKEKQVLSPMLLTFISDIVQVVDGMAHKVLFLIMLCWRKSMTWKHKSRFHLFPI
jgi:hypothetical protein